MPKSILMRILLIAGSAMIIVGVSLMGWMMATEEEQNVIRVELDEGDTETVGFEALALVPGESCEYTVLLKKESTAKFDLRLQLSETEAGRAGTLKNFARVKILSGETVLYDELLLDAFTDEAILVPVDFDQNQNTELKLVYYLPIGIGNEAKNAEAEFELLLTASNE